MAKAKKFLPKISKIKIILRLWQKLIIKLLDIYAAVCVNCRGGGGQGAELDNMFVEEKFRNNGLGRVLVDNFIDWCEKKRVDYIDVRASMRNAGGIQFYKRAGFKDYDIVLEMKLSK